MLMISSPLSFSLSPSEGHLLTTQSLKKNQVENEKGGKEHTSVCLHVKSRGLRPDFNQRKSLPCEIYITVSHISVKCCIWRQRVKKQTNKQYSQKEDLCSRLAVKRSNQ